MTGNLFETSVPPESPGEWFTAHCDGGSRGNPGPSGYGAVIEDAQGPRRRPASASFLGIQTNNYAEYSGLLAVLEWAIENGAKRLRVISDSELMVKQMKGPVQGEKPRFCSRYGSRPDTWRTASMASRCATPSAAATRKPTAWPTKPWTKAWAESAATDQHAGLTPWPVAQVSI